MTDIEMKDKAKEVALTIAACEIEKRGEFLLMVADALRSEAQGFTARTIRVAANYYGVAA